MSVSSTMQNYLDRWGVEYDLVPHSLTGSSQETAEAAHISGDNLAKAVLTEDYHGYLMVVIPADHQVEFEQLQAEFDRNLELATEEELAEIFSDCEVGAIPPLGEAYGIDVAIDDSLKNCENIYFEAGDHAALVRMRGEDFRDLMASADHGKFSSHM